MLELLLFPVVFLLIALATRKDIAIVVFAANVVAVIAAQSDITHEAQYVLYALLTAGIAAHAGSQIDYGQKLSRSIAAICLLTLMVQVCALVSWQPFIPHIATGLQFAAAIVLVTFDGRRGLIRDMADDVGSCFRSLAGVSRRTHRHQDK